MKKLFIVAFVAISYNMSAQYMIGQTKEFIISQHKDLYIGINNDSSLVFQDLKTGNRLVYCFFHSNLCNGATEEMSATRTAMICKDLRDNGYLEVPKSNKTNHLYNPLNKVETWIECGNDKCLLLSKLN